MPSWWGRLRASRPLLAAAVVMSFAAPVVALGQSGGDPSRQDEPSAAQRSPKPEDPPKLDDRESVRGLERAAEADERRRRERDEPEARAERRASRSKYKDKSRAEALAIARRHHDDVVGRKAWKPLRLGADDELKQYRGRNVALVERDGKELLVESMLPLVSSVASGEQRPVSLELERVAGGFEPANPIVPTEIASRPNLGVDFPRSDIGFRLEGGSVADAAQLAADSVFYANSATDTDFVLAPSPTGVQALWHVRSPDAPEQAVLAFRLPTGARLREAADNTGRVEVVKGTTVVASVTPPHAWDAQGAHVPATAEVDGQRLVVRFPHRERDFAYPIVVDPVVDNYRIYNNAEPNSPATKTGATDYVFAGWDYYQVNSWGYSRNGSSYGNGLYVYTLGNVYYTAGHYGEWIWRVPRSQSFIERADFGYVTHEKGLPTTCIIEGIYRSDVQNWNYGRWAQAAGYEQPGHHPSSPWIGPDSWWYAERRRNACEPQSSNYKAHHPDAPANANMMVYGLYAAGTGYVSPRGLVHMYGASMFLNDRNTPWVTGTSGPAGWVDQGWHTVGVAGGDAGGLGVRGFNIFPPNHTPEARYLRSDKSVTTDPNQACYGGGYNNTCPEYGTVSFGVDAGRLNEGEYAVGGGVYDALAKNVNWSVPFKVDHSSPTTSPSGSLLAQNLDKNRRYTLRVDANDRWSGVRTVEVKIDGARIPDGWVDRGCGANPGCARDFSKTWEIDTANYSYGSHTVEVFASDAVGRPAPVERRTFAITDKQAPRLEVTGGLRQPFALRRDLHMKATDSETGVRSLELWLDPDSTPTRSEAEDFKDGTCPTSTTCPATLEDDWVLPSDVPEGEHTILVRATDGGGLTTDERWTIRVVDLRAGSREKLGLEHWFQYDDTEAGGNSRVFVNAETGNSVWHTVPIVAEGRGLSTVVNLTYNAHDRGGLAGTSLGRIPLVDVSEQTNGAIARDLPGFSYAEAGAGFSIAVSGPTRVNEPLGGVLFAQAAEESVEPAPGVKIDPSCGGPAPVVPKLNCGQEIVLTDADGTMHVFTKSGDRWVAPPGVDMHLRRYRNGGDSLNPIEDKWAMTRPDGVTHFFDNNGYLQRTVDRHANALDYDYERYNAFTDEPCAGTDPIGRLISSTPGAEKLCALRLVAVRDPAGRELKIDYVDRTGEGLLDNLAAGLHYAYPPGIPGVIGGRAGRIDTITHHDGRVYDLDYTDGYLTRLTEAANRADKRVTEFVYEDAAEGLRAIGQDRQLLAVVDMRDEDKDGTFTEHARTSLRHETRDESFVPGSYRPPRRAKQLTKRSGTDEAYDYFAPTDAAPRRFEVSEQVLGATRAVTRHELDGRGRPTRVTTPGGRHTTVAWNDRQNKVADVRRASGTGDESRESFEYYDDTTTGALRARTTYPKWPSEDGSRRTEFGYTFSEGRWQADRDYDPATPSEDAGQRFVADLDRITPPKEGTGWTFTVDPATGEVRERKDAGGYTARTDYDDLGRIELEQSEVPGENPLRYTAWHASGQPETVVDQRGKTWRFRYDGAGNLVKVIDPRAGDAPSEAKGAPYVTTLTYDSFDRLVEEHVPKRSADGEFITRTREFDRDDNVTKASEPGVATGSSATTTIEYTKMGQPRRVVEPGSSAAEVTTYVYDDADRLIGEIEPKGSEADATVLREGHAGACGESRPPAIAYATRYCLDADGRRVAEIRTSTREGDPSALITSFAYDDRDNLLGFVDPERNETATVAAAIRAADDRGARRTRYEYDKTDAVTVDVEQPNDGAPEVRWSYEYDANGNRSLVHHPTGGATDEGRARTTQLFYDHRDQLIATVNPAGAWTCTKRREDGRVVAETSPRGVAAEDGDDLGAKCRNGDPRDLYRYFTTRFVYDAAGDVREQWVPHAPGQYGRSDADLDKWKVVYETRDAVGNPLQIRDARGNLITNEFFDTGDLLSTTRPSFFDLRWDDDARPHARGGQRFEAADDLPFQIAVGGPRIQPREVTSRNAERSADAPSVPQTLGQTDFGAVDPEPLPELLPQAGKTWFAYDGRMRLTKVTDADDQERRLTYDDAGRVRTTSWPFVRDLAGTDANEEERIRHVFDYDAHGNLTSFQDGEGATTTFGYDGYDRLVTEIAPGAHDTTVAGDPRPETTRFEYDLNGNLAKRHTPRGVAGEGDGPVTFEYGHDSLDRLVRESNPAGETWTYGYDGANNVEVETRPRGQAAGDRIAEFQTRFRYDAADRVDRITRQVRDGETIKDIVTRLEYDADGNRQKVIEPGAVKEPGGDLVEHVTEVVHDGRGLPWKRTVGTGDEARTTISEFDANGNLRRVVKPAGVGADRDADVVDDGTNAEAATKHATLREYDQHDLLTTVRLPWDDRDTRKFRQEFQRTDSQHRVTSILSPHEASSDSVARTSYAYYDTGWVRWASDEKLTNPDSTKRVFTRAIDYAYDERGNQTRWTSKNANETAAGREIVRTFWPNGLLRTRTAKKTTDPDQPGTRRRYEYLYNRNRSLVRMVDEDLGRPTLIRRDVAEREERVNEAWTTGRDTMFVYDAGGNVRERRTDGKIESDGSFTGPDAKVTTFAYDSLDREIEMTVEPAVGDTRRTTTAYHPSGERRERVKPNGTVDRWFSNSRGERVRHERDPATGDTETQTYDYDVNGNRSRDERGTHEFNARDQLVKWTRPGDHKTKPGWTTTFAVNGDGATTKRTERDKAGALKEEATFTYVGERLKRVVTDSRTGTLPTKVQADFFHDDFGNVVRIERKVLSDNTVLSTPDRTGLEPEECDEVPDRTDTTTTHYCYDEFERLVFSKGQGVDDPARIRYDGLDRRDAKTTETATGNKTRDYSYVGLTEQLSREVDADGDRKAYDYDSIGERQGQSSRDAVTGETKFRSYAFDANGSTVGLEEGDGQIPDDQRYDYDPYGELQPRTLTAVDPETGLSEAAKENPFRFEGFYYDSGVKTYDMHARHYRPDIGRFLSQDRYADAANDQILQADPLTQNRYAFAGGNPVNNVEFDGHIFDDLLKAIQRVVRTVARVAGRAAGAVAGRTASQGAHASSSGGSGGGVIKTVVAVVRRLTAPPPQVAYDAAGQQSMIDTPAGRALRRGLADLLDEREAEQAAANAVDEIARREAERQAMRSGLAMGGDPQLDAAIDILTGIGGAIRSVVKGGGRRAGLGGKPPTTMAGLVARFMPQAVKDLRRAYVNDVRGILPRSEKLLARGLPEETVARIANVQRRQIAYRYKKLTPQPWRSIIYRRNRKEYGDPLGPTYEWLRVVLGRSDRQIIESAARPGGEDLGLLGY